MTLTACSSKRRKRATRCLIVKIIDRAALSHPVLTGISRERLGGLSEELADPWLAQQESRLRIGVAGVTAAGRGGRP